MFARLPVDELADALGLDARLVEEVLDAAHRVGIVFVAGESVILREPTLSRLNLGRDDDGRWSSARGLLDDVPARGAGFEDVEAVDQPDPRQRPAWEEAAHNEPGGRVESIRAWLASQGRN